MTRIEQHNEEIQRNLQGSHKKLVLKRVYRDFHQLIATHLAETRGQAIVELGSGIGDITDVIPGCLRTDLFPNPRIDRTENAYSLSFSEAAVSNLILFDVFHHLRYPGTAFKEFHRVLAPGGRVILFEPCLSLLGWIVYGALHPEPLGRFQPIHWLAPSGWSPADIDYYAAQANATRIFLRGEFSEEMSGWTLVRKIRLSAISYVASGGYSGPQLYPDRAYPLMRRLDAICDRAPLLFATRMLIVLEKK